MASLFSQQFMRAINFVLSPNAEGSGAISLDPKDDGNWTGGVAGKGTLVGTKWGISAADFPQLDIPSLSRENAVAIYQRKYWNAIQGDALAPRLSICVLDSAVNQGVEASVSMLQKACNIQADGAMGPITISAARAIEQDYLITCFMAQRALRYAQSKQLSTFGKDWMRRCFCRDDGSEPVSGLQPQRLLRDGADNRRLGSRHGVPV